MFERIEIPDARECVVSEPGASKLTPVEASFAGQIATAVWIGQLTEKAAEEALSSYAIACHLCERGDMMPLREALLAEYRHCRERQDLSS